MAISFVHRAFLALAIAASLLAPASAADWVPTKTVRIVVPIVGSTNDVLARLVAPGRVIGRARSQRLRVHGRFIGVISLTPDRAA